MPLTREQSNYINTGGTVFFPSVAIDNTLGVRGNSVFDGSVTFNNLLNIKNDAVFDSTSTFNGTTTFNGAVNPITSINGFTQVTGSSANPISLTSLSNRYLYVNAGGSVQLVLLPNTSTLRVGQSFIISNTPGGQGMTVQTSTGVELFTGGGNVNFSMEFICVSTANNNASSWNVRFTGFNNSLIGTSNSASIDLFTGTTGGTITIGSSATPNVLIPGNLTSNVVLTAKTANYQLTTSDANKVIQMNGAFAFQIDTSLATLALGTNITLVAQTAGVTVAANGGSVVPTINATPGLKLRAAWSTATLIKMSNSSASGTASTWLLTGDLIA